MTNDPALMRDPKLEGLRGRLLKTALGFYREIQASLEEDASPEARSQLSEAYDRIAYISWELGLSDEALATYRRALALVEQLVADAPSAPENRAALARCLTRIGFTLRTRSSPAEALQPYQQAQEIQERLAVEYPAEPRYQEALSWTLSNIGVIHRDLGHPADAIRFHRQAIEIHEKLVQQDPQKCPVSQRAGLVLALPVHGTGGRRRLEIRIADWPSRPRRCTRSSSRTIATMPSCAGVWPGVLTKSAEYAAAPAGLPMRPVLWSARQSCTNPSPATIPFCTVSTLPGIN